MLARLFGTGAKGLCKVYSPTLFLIALEDSNPDFTGRRQQDTQEFLSYLLNTIEEETRLPMKEGKEVSPISDEFKGLGTNSIKCLKCGSESKSEEQFLALSLEIPQSNVLMRLTERSRKMLSVEDLERNQERSESMWNRFRGFFSQSGKTVITLYDCLLSHTLPERLQDTEQYFCEHCNELVDSEKVFKISASPNTLILHFKRFKYSFFGSKVDTYIQYPMELHFSEFTTGSESVLYDLSAVVVHSGRGVSRGHYTTYRKINSSTGWFLFDDAKVTRVLDEDVLDQEAYVLFYTRKFEQRLVAYSPPESTEMCFVLKYWLLKLKTLASPGPLTQQHILCPHGKLSVRYSLQKDFSEVSVSFYAEMVRNVRYMQFGGDERPMKDIEECVECTNLAARLTKRMALEGKILDKISFIPKGDQPWFLIPKKWHQTWKSFVLAKKVVPELVLVPGPVDTSDLLDAAGVPKKGLVPLKHYKVVTQVLWEALDFLYGCETPIRREKVDIYGKEPEMTEDRRTLLSDEQIQELAEIKRIEIR